MDGTQRIKAKSSLGSSGSWACVATCKLMGYSRDSFYDSGGEDTLRELSRRNPNLRNRMTSDLEDAIAAVGINKPAWDSMPTSSYRGHS